MLEITILLFLVYLSLWLYTLSLFIKLRKSLYKIFPEEFVKIIGKDKIFGISANPFFLLDKEVKELSVRNNDTNRLRKTTIRYFYISIIPMFSFVPTLFIILIIFFKV